MRFNSVALLLALGLAACAPPAPPPAIPPPQVVPGTSAVRPTSAMLDPYVGSYRRGPAMLTVRRAGDALIIDRPGQPPLGLTLVGLATFADAGGNAYLFTPGGAARLLIVTATGARQEWAR